MRELILTSHTKEQIIRHETEQHFKSQNFTIGLNHGKLNPLSSTWTYPKLLQTKILVNIFIRGSTNDNVPPLRYIVK